PSECVESIDSGWGAVSGGSRSGGPSASYGGNNASRWRPRRTDNEFDQSVPDVEAASDEQYITSPSRPSSEAKAPDASESRIDYAAFDDVEPNVRAVRRGTRVMHARFGRGTVQSVTPGEPPKVLARFPGWGERRVLLTKLRLQ